jgi:hypothetical protein
MRALAFPLLVAVAGCGIGFAGDGSGGDEDLPTAGAGPFRKLEFDENTPADEPWLATDRTLDFTEPSLVPRSGGGFVYFYTRENPDPPVGDGEILRGAIADPTDLPDEPPVPVLVADQAWEEGHVAAPSVLDDGGTLVMYYEAGVSPPGMARAMSSDGGRTWLKFSVNPILDDVVTPSVATDGRGAWIAAFTRTTAPGIWLARSEEGMFWTADAAPILLPNGTPDSFERTALGSPHIAWLEESTGRGHWALWYAGLEETPEPGDAPRYAIGYAASFDGMAWDRLGGGRPVLAAPSGAPAVLVDGPTATLLFDAANGRRMAVGVALHP